MGFSLRGVLPDDGLALIGKKFSLFRGGRGKIKWRPWGDLNPRRRRERAVSLAGLDDGDARSGEPSRSRTYDPLIKSQMLYQLSYGLPPEKLYGKGRQTEVSSAEWVLPQDRLGPVGAYGDQRNLHVCPLLPPPHVPLSGFRKVAALPGG